MIIAVDFDGTIVKHAYPDIGEDINAFPVLRQLLAEGHKLILYTMRSGESLTAAIRYCKQRNVDFWGVNINPEQINWTQSPKAYAQLYIDDAALGIPLIRPDYDRPWVNWHKVRNILVEQRILKEN